MHHSMRAAARIKRNVLAPRICGRLRHWSCPSLATAFLSRMAISTAQRWADSRRISAALNVRAVVQKASRAGGGFLWPGPVRRTLPGRGGTTTRTRGPGNTAGHRQSALVEEDGELLSVGVS